MSRHEFQYDQQEVDEGKARAFRSTGKFKKNQNSNVIQFLNIFSYLIDAFHFLFPVGKYILLTIVHKTYFKIIFSHFS